MLKRDCQAAVSAKIQKIMHEKKKRPLKQAVAIAFSMVRKASPTCDRLLKPQQHSPKQQKHSPTHQKHSLKHQKHSPKHQKHSPKQHSLKHQKHSPKHQRHSLRKASPKKH
jgi:hypothetical protein